MPRPTKPAVRSSYHALVSGLFSKAGVIGLTGIYFALLAWSYVKWLSPQYHYLGFTLDPTRLGNMLPALLMCVAITPFLPNRIGRASQFACWMAYFMLFVPILCYVPIQANQVLQVGPFIALMGVSMLIICMMTSYRLGLGTIRVPTVVFDIILWASFALLFFYIMVSLRGSLRFVGLADVYLQREVGGGALSGSYIGYATGLLSNAICPVMMAIGIVRRKPVMILAGTAGFVLIYMTAALKAVLLSIVFLPAFYFFVVTQERVSGLRIGMIMVGLVAFSAIILMLNDLVLNEFLTEIVALLLMRTFSVGPALTGLYADFFSFNPVTAFTHINVVRILAPYPYDAPVGIVVATWGLGIPGVNANANFWATDGLASMGLWGLPVAGFLFGLAMNVMDMMTSRMDQRIVYLALIPFLMSVFNNSLFTSLLTGGGGGAVLLLYLYAGTRQT